ncbi:MAG: glycosyltransferase [Proteobacteria bacterium]|nr:glycosyltransferase [Pseudomonadota bacterium]
MPSGINTAGFKKGVKSISQSIPRDAINIHVQSNTKKHKNPRKRYIRTDYIDKKICDEYCKIASRNFSAYGNKGRVSAVMYLIILVLSIIGGLGIESFYPFYFIACIVSFLLAFGRYAAIFHKKDKSKEDFPKKTGQIAPIYSILIALYKEADVIEDLVKNLENLSWPRDKLDIIFLCEEDDISTQDEIIKYANPLNSRLIILANGMPRTKPRALNIGLEYAIGRFVCVYDAEDKPHPMQLRQAFFEFCNGGDKLGVVQAPLVTHNDKESLIASLFTLDYAVWFRVLLPFICDFTGFIPLGGTSNHFRKSTLKKLGGWDPYNLTEDADLGVKLGRFGYYSKIIDFPTIEEAPPKTSQWIKQRTRWIHGHIQTIGVHFENALELLGQLKLQKFLGLILGIAAGPLFVGLRVFMLSFGLLNLQNETNNVLNIVMLIMLLAEFGLHFIAINRDGRIRLWQTVLFLPFYWILQSIAYIRASIHIFTKPFVWEKTAHGKSARNMYVRNNNI